MKPVLAALLLAATPAAAQIVQPIPVAVEGTLLTVEARGEVRQAPDLVRISAGVVTEAATAEAAMRENRQRMERVIAALIAAGVEREDIQTSNFNLHPQYRYAENQPPKITGYRVENTVSVELEEIEQSGEVLDALVAVGANQIYGPSFEIEDRETALNAARREAIQEARARAELYAEATGLSVARIVAISEGAPPPPPYPMPMMRTMAVAEDAASTPIEPGQLDLTANVTVVYELR